MPVPNQPNSVRYLKARLRILKRPMVWGSASALLLAILLFSEYWNHSERFSGIDGDRTPTSGVASLDGLSNQTGLPSQEDSAIGIDIDSLPVIINELGAASPTPLPQPNQQPQATLPGAGNQPSPAASPSGTTATFQDQAEAEPSTSRNPFVPDTRNARLFEVNLPGLNQTNPAGLSTDIPNGIPNPGFSAGNNSTPTSSSQPSIPTSTNSLQSAVRRGQQPGQSSSNQPASSEQSQLLPAQALPGQLLPSGQQFQNPALPRTSPPIGTTGYTIPPSLTVVPSTPTNPYSNSGASQPSYGTLSAPQIAPPTLPNQAGVRPSTSPTSIYGGNQGAGVNPYANPYGGSIPNPAPTPQVIYTPSAPAPFTAPHSRGGGRINTFANP